MREDIAALRCSQCGTEEPDKASTYACRRCGPLGVLDVHYHWQAATASSPDRTQIAHQRGRGIERWLPLLPVSTKLSLLGIGDTPLRRAPRLSAALGCADLWLKDERANLSGSLKDRASAVVLARAADLGCDTIALASTGNAGVALAALAAATGQRAIVYVPERCPPVRQAAIRAFGAELCVVRGSYDDAVAQCRAACERHGWYCRSTGYNPFTSEGKKTVAYELWEELADVPDAVVVPVGDGNILAGIYRGFRDLVELGWAARMPRIIGVQAAGSAAIARAWQRGDTSIAPVVGSTRAHSIGVSEPNDGVRALHAVRNTAGTFVIVGEETIDAGQRWLAALAGISADPACGAAVAGLRQWLARDPSSAGARVAIIITGSAIEPTPPADDRSS